MGALGVRDMAIIAAGLLLAVVALRGNAGKVGTGLVTAGADLASGVVIGIGETVGIPPTDKTQFQKDVAAGDWWAASFSGTAGEFVGSFWNHMTGDNAGTTKGGGASGSW
jgi:hypothetical protein